MKRFIKKILNELKKYFLTGLVTILPIFITVYIIAKSVVFFDEKFKSLFHLNLKFPGIGIVIFSLIIIFIGVITRYYIGKKFLHLFEFILTKLPFIKRFYSAIKQVSNAILGDKKFIFKKVVLIEYPRRGAYTIGFLTSIIENGSKLGLENGKFCSVFVPTTPNPTSGFIIIIPEEEIIILDISVEDGMKYVISAGALDITEVDKLLIDE